MVSLIKALNSNQKAFTIIEIILFLALSAGLLSLAFAGLQGRNERVRFAQGLRFIESVISQEQGTVSNGAVEQRDQLTCNGSVGDECLFLGKMLEFTQNSGDVVVHTISGRLQSASGDLALTLYQSEPFTAAATQRTFDLDWGLEFVSATINGIDSGNPSVENRIFGYVRSPGGTEIVPLAFTTGDGPGNALSAMNEACLYAPQVEKDLPGVTCPGGLPYQSSINESFEAKLCFRSPEGTYGQIVLGGAERKEAIKANFEEVPECTS